MTTQEKKWKCNHRSTYINGLGSEICTYCGQTVNQPDTITSNSTETPKRMKPLDKLEQEMFKAMIGRPWRDCKKQWFGPKEDFDLYEQNARECAQIAKDLARRAWDSGSDSSVDIYYGRDHETFTEFLTSEGITE